MLYTFCDEPGLQIQSHCASWWYLASYWHESVRLCVSAHRILVIGKIHGDVWRHSRSNSTVLHILWSQPILVNDFRWRVSMTMWRDMSKCPCMRNVVPMRQDFQQHLLIVIAISSFFFYFFMLFLRLLHTFFLLCLSYECGVCVAPSGESRKWIQFDFWPYR